MPQNRVSIRRAARAARRFMDGIYQVVVTLRVLMYAVNLVTPIAKGVKNGPLSGLVTDYQR